jgi:hypothetical protein
MEMSFNEEDRYEGEGDGDEEEGEVSTMNEHKRGK